MAGIELLNLRLRNVVYFKAAEVPLNLGQLVTIRGNNRDGNIEEQVTGNGAGKSLLLSTIGNVLYQAPPVSLKRKAKKDLLGKGSEIELELRRGNNIYSITQFPTKYVIKRDGVDLQIRTVPLAEQFIRQTFPLSELDFYTYGYVSVQRPFAFYASDTDRLNSFGQLFRLTDYDKVRTYFTTKLRNVKDDEIRASVLEGELASLALKIKALQRTGGLDDTLPDQQKKYEDQKVKLDDLLYAQRLKLKALKQLVELDKELTSAREDYKLDIAPADAITQLRQWRKQWQEYLAYSKEFNNWKLSAKKIQAQVDELHLPETSLDQANEQTATLIAQIEQLEVKFDKLRPKQAKFQELQSQAQRIKKKLVELGHTQSKKFPDNLDSEVSALETVLSLERLLIKQRDGHCPTCHSPVNVKHIKKQVESARIRLPKLQKMQQARQLVTDLRKLRADAMALKFDEDILRQTQVSLKKLRNDKEALDTDIDTWSRHRQLRKALAGLEKPKKVEQPDCALSESEVDQQLEICDKVLQVQRAQRIILKEHADLNGLKADTLRAAYKLTVKEIDKLETHQHVVDKKLAAILQQLDAEKQRRTELNLYKKQQAKNQDELKALGSNLDNKHIYLSLTKAYGPKGLKISVIDKISRVLEDNLNHYRDLLFAEPFHFSVQVKETGMKIIVDRGHNKISDVRNMSGAESNNFRLLFLGSLLPLIPQERALNTLILDEPTSNQDEASRSLVINRFLPYLHETIPNIFVITVTPETYPNSLEWQVSKYRGVSKLLTH